MPKEKTLLQDDVFLEILISIIQVRDNYGEIFKGIYELFTNRFGPCFLALGFREENKLNYPYLGNSEGIKDYNSSIDLEKDVTSQGRKCLLEAVEIYIKDARRSTYLTFKQKGNYNTKSDTLTRSAIYIPLGNSEETIGVFTIQSLEPNFFSEEDLILLRKASKCLYVIIKNFQEISLIYGEYQAKTKILTDLYNYDILTGFKTEKCFYERKNKIIDPSKPVQDFLMIKFSSITSIKSKTGILFTEAMIEDFSKKISTFLKGHIVSSYRVSYGTFYFEVKDIEKIDISPIFSIIDKVSQLKEYNFDLNPAILKLPNRFLQYEQHLEDIWADTLNKSTNYTEVSDEIIDSYKNKWFAEKNIHEALEKEVFFINFQPKIDGKSEKILGVEALARWIDPEIGFISPFVFIGIAEKKGIIPTLDKLIFKKALKAFKVWKTDSSIEIPEGFLLSVNTSIQTLESDNFLSYLINTCEEIGVSPKDIELEITESVFSKDLSKIVQLTKELKELGFSISIDDFTTGFSSVVYLDKINPNIIKLDKSLVDNIGKDVTEKILFFIINLVKSLDFKVTVEGVETQDQLNYIREIGVDLIQGYYYSKPLPEDQLIDKYLKK